jgi:hypothetical protein
MGLTTIVTMGAVLLAIYGILRIGISIGVKRATKNVVVGFLMEAQLSQVTHEGRELVVGLADHDSWYNLFGSEFSLEERRKENRTREIGGTLWELTFHEQRKRARSKKVTGPPGSIRKRSRLCCREGEKQQLIFHLWIPQHERLAGPVGRRL